MIELCDSLDCTFGTPIYRNRYHRVLDLADVAKLAVAELQDSLMTTTYSSPTTTRLNLQYPVFLRPTPAARLCVLCPRPSSFLHL